MRMRVIAFVCAAACVLWPAAPAPQALATLQVFNDFRLPEYDESDGSRPMCAGTKP